MGPVNLEAAGVHSWEGLRGECRQVGFKAPRSSAGNQVTLGLPGPRRHAQWSADVSCATRGPHILISLRPHHDTWIPI